MSGNFDLQFEDMDILSMLDSDDEFLMQYLNEEVPQQSVETTATDNNEGKPQEVSSEKVCVTINHPIVNNSLKIHKIGTMLIKILISINLKQIHHF